jgi:hypothetical protein
MELSVKKAFGRAKVVFSELNIPKGFLPFAAIKKLLMYLQVQPGDTFWELGAGECRLAYCLSTAAHGGTVVVTDVGNKYLCMLYKKE